MGKDYRREAGELRALIEATRGQPGGSLLDVACGTGAHLAVLRETFDVEGLDLDENMLRIARDRLPGVPLHQGDLVDFTLPRRFDAVTCLFSSVGYVQTREGLGLAVDNMVSHLLPGGVLVLEPWIGPADWKPGKIGAVYVDEPSLKAARIDNGRMEGSLSILDFQYLVGTPAGLEHFTEQHTLALFTPEEYRDALQSAGLEVSHHSGGFPDRGRWVGHARSG